MARTVDKVKLKLELEGFSAIKSIGKDFEKFTSTVSITPKKLDSLLERLKKVNKTTQLSKNSFEGQIGVLTKLRNSVGIGTEAYDRLGKEIDQVRASMDALNASGKKQSFFGKVGVGGKAAAGAAIGSVASRFLPAGAATGASVGALAGGVPGAVTGAAIGLTVDAAAGLVGVAKATAQYSAQIKRLEVALRGVTKSQTEFNKAQQVIKSVSKELNVPIAAATQQFTTLTASVIGAGGSVDEAEKVFRGVSEAIKATGGDAEDVKSAIRAMSQIFGKGKVSAEELQGQLGERLPGAVTKFALATGRTLPQLQKDLRDGTVGLNDVMKFVVKLSEDHSEAAKAMAASSADAGQRMQVTFDELKKNVGDILQPIGSQIQDMTEIAISSLNRFIEEVRKFMKVGEEFELETLERRKKQIEKTLGKRAFTGYGDAVVSSLPIMRELDLLSKINTKFIDEDKKESLLLELKTIEKDMKRIKERRIMMDQLLNIQEKGFDLGLNIPNLSSDLPNIFAPQEDGDGNVFEDPVSKEAAEDTKKAKEILDKYRESVKQVNQDIANSFVNTFKKMEDALVEFVLKGTLNFRKLAQSIIADITRIIIRSKVIQPLTGMLGNLFNPTPKNTLNPFTMDLGGSNFVGSNFDLGGSFSQFADIPQSTIRKTTFGDKVSAFGTRIGDFFKQKFADGGVIPKNKIVPYAKGGLITRPQLFPLADGAALAGEAGVEAIMPLRRGRDGKLGVEASGGNIGNITVNVDASGSSVEGDTNQSQELGNILGAAIQAELIRQKRPGGLLG